MVCRFLHISEAVINTQWQKEAHILENNIRLLLRVLLHGTLTKPSTDHHILTPSQAHIPPPGNPSSSVDFCWASSAQ